MADLPGAAGQAAHDPASTASAGGPGAAASGSAPSRLWRLAVARSIPALLTGLVTVFTGGHSPQFGLLLFGIWAVLDALASLPLLGRAGLVDTATRRLLLVRVLVVGVAGLLAVALSSVGPGALVLVIGLAALAGGALDLVAGLRSRGALAVSRDLVIAGGAALVLAIGSLIIPPGLQQPFPGAGGHPGVLTTGTIVTGLFGAWGIVTGVLWAIAAVGLRWPGRPAAAATAAPGAAPGTSTGSAR